MKIPAWALLIVACVMAATALAQTYKWVDKDGKIRYGDTPPPGVNAKTLSTPRGGGSPAVEPAANDTTAGKNAPAKGARKGPLTPAEQEMEFRRRAKEAKENAAKAEKDKQEADARKQNCQDSRESLRALESGQRIARTDAQGERYVLDEAQTAQEAARARQAVSQWCQ